MAQLSPTLVLGGGHWERTNNIYESENKSNLGKVGQLSIVDIIGKLESSSSNE